MLSEYIEVGEVLRPQGIAGLVKVRPDTETADRFFSFSSLFAEIGGKLRQVPVEDVSVRDGFVYLRLDHAQDRDTAEKQRGWILKIDRAHARKLGDQEWFVCDLIGCHVTGDKGAQIGQVRDVLLSGPNPVFEVKTDKGMLLVAALKFVIVRVDVAEKLIVLNEDRLWEAAVYE